MCHFWQRTRWTSFLVTFVRNSFAYQLYSSFQWRRVFVAGRLLKRFQVPKCEVGSCWEIVGVSYLTKPLPPWVQVAIVSSWSVAGNLCISEHLDTPFLTWLWIQISLSNIVVIFMSCKLPIPWCVVTWRFWNDTQLLRGMQVAAIYCNLLVLKQETVEKCLPFTWVRYFLFAWIQCWWVVA